MRAEQRSSLSATEWAALVLDPGWKQVEDSLHSADPLGFPGYRDQGRPRDAVLAAAGSVSRRPVEMVVFDFSSFGGSLGVVAGERIARAFERAVARRAGVVALLATGGARMQEGMVALVQMAKTVLTRQELARAGLPFVAYLCHPTTGGAYASFGALADFVWAEPGATVGFAGPRIAERTTGVPLPETSHTAESAFEHGLIDAVVPPNHLRSRVAEVLDLTLGEDTPVAEGSHTGAPGPPGRAWEEVVLARHPSRPTARSFAERIAAPVVPIRGDRAGTSDTGVLTALARVAGTRVGIIAHDRRRLPPGAYRCSQRLIRMAGRFGLPLVTLVDTPGAEPGAGSEAGGIVRAIAGTFRDVLEHPRPTLSIVTGEGGSGGALAFACADRVLALEHSTFSVIGPEGAAAILRREDVRDVAEDLRLRACDLVTLGIADGVIAEPPPGAHAHPEETARRIAEAAGDALRELGEAGDPREARALRWREAGNRFLEGA